MKMTVTMQWQKGFFRLWVLVAVVWLVVASAVSQPWSIWIDYSHSGAQLTEVSAGYDKVKAAISSGGVTNKDGKFMDVASLILLRDGLSSHRAEIEASVTQSRSSFLSAMLSILLPPVVLLAFGTAVAWVLRGFKRNTYNRDLEG